MLKHVLWKTICTKKLKIFLKLFTSMRFGNEFCLGFRPEVDADSPRKWLVWRDVASVTIVAQQHNCCNETFLLTNISSCAAGPVRETCWGRNRWRCLETLYGSCQVREDPSELIRHFLRMPRWWCIRLEFRQFLSATGSVPVQRVNFRLHISLNLSQIYLRFPEVWTI